MIVASGWKPGVKGARQGYVDLELYPSRLLLHGCTLMASHGKRWIGLPGRPQTNKDGVPVIDPKTNKQAWWPVIEIKDPAARARFQTAALGAVDKLLGKGSAP